MILSVIPQAPQAQCEGGLRDTSIFVGHVGFPSH